VLPDSLVQLPQLRQLDVSYNQLTTLPESLGQLTQLERLDLSHNLLAVLPVSIRQLRQLWRVRLNNNKLTSLPESLRHLKALKELYLHNNPGLGLSPEVLGANFFDVLVREKTPARPQAILALYFGQRKFDAKPLNEVKLLLVGHGRVGKTSLSKALRGVTHYEREPETPDIERHSLSLTAGKSKITAHVWDFGKPLAHP
jgi:internalin A